MRPLATETNEYPPPIPLAFHARGGPSLGHSLSRPVSFEMPSRLGPRNCGQSNDDACTAEGEDAPVPESAARAEWRPVAAKVTIAAKAKLTRARRGTLIGGRICGRMVMEDV